MRDEHEVKKHNLWFSAISGTLMGVAISYAASVGAHFLGLTETGQRFRWIKPDEKFFKDMHICALIMGAGGAVTGYTEAKLHNKDHEIGHLQRELEKRAAESTQYIKTTP